MRPHSTALLLLLASAPALARFRGESDLRVTQIDAVVWLAGSSWDEDRARRFRGVPGGHCFHVLSDGQLVEMGNRLPTDHLPDAVWEPLDGWLRIELPSAHWGARVSRTASLRMVRGGEVGEANVVLTTAERWAAWAGAAPLVRLAPLVFAADRSGRLVVWGRPLPSLPGQWFLEREGVASPAGWTWAPPLAPQTVAAVLEVAPGDLALLHRDGTRERIERNRFVHAGRSAARATAEALR